MPTSKAIIPYPQVSGMDSTNKPFAVPQTQWTSQHNMRSSKRGLVQVPPLVTKGQWDGSEEFLAMIALPSGYLRGIWLMLTEHTALQWRDSVTGCVVLTMKDGSEIDFNRSEPWWSWTKTDGRVYFVNEENNVHCSDGTTVERLANSPKAKFIENFFDHIVVANDFFNGEYGPMRVRWSHLYDFDKWGPTAENEADFFDLTGWERSDDSSGRITAMSKINDLLIVYTSDGVFGVRYVGLPKIMQFFPLSTDVGCASHRAFASHRNMHFFYDSVEGDFNMFDGQSFQSIGGPILGYLQDTVLATAPVPASCFTVATQQEVYWTFYRNGTLWNCAIYNWRLKEWRTGTLSNLIYGTAGGRGMKRATTIDEFSVQPIDAFDNVNIDAIDDLSAEAALPLVWFGGATRVFRDAITTDADNLLGVQDVPTLISNDRYYGDPENFKEFDTVCIHAKYLTTAGAATGVKVYLSARNYIDDAVTWTLLGTWTPALVEGRLTFERKSGRVFRWKFEFVGTTSIPRGCEWSLYVENVYGVQAEK